MSFLSSASHEEDLVFAVSDLDALMDMTEVLSGTLDVLEVVPAVADAIAEVIPDDAFVSCVPFVASGSIAEPCGMFVSGSGVLGRAYLEDVANGFRAFFSLLPPHLRLGDGPRDAFDQEKMLGVFQSSMDESQDVDMRLERTHYFPMFFGDRLIGLFCVSSPEERPLSWKYIVLARAMIASAALVVLRQRNLLETETAKIRNVVENITNGVIVFEASGEIVLMNPQAVSMTGTPPTETSLETLLASFDGDALSLLIQDAMGPNLVQKPIEIEREDSVFEVQVEAVDDGQVSGKTGVIVLHDVSHYKQLSKVKDEFLSVASHELRTPLTAIAGNVDMVLAGETGLISSESKDYLKDVASAADRLVSLVNDMLDVSRVEAGRMKFEMGEIDLHACATVVEKDLKTLALAKNIELVNEISEGGPLLSADENKLIQVLENIVGNAIKFTKHGSVTMSCTRAGDLLDVSIADTGIGIPKEDLEKLFKKFSRLDDEYSRQTPGTGLGLYISLQIVRNMGGQAWAESDGPGKGSTFHFLVPIAGTAAAKDALTRIESDSRRHPDQK